MLPQMVRLSVLSAVVAGVSLALPIGKHGASLYARLTRAPGSSFVSLTDSLNVPLNSPGVIQRSMCLAVALSRRAAYQCGDLALSYELPAVRVLGKTTAPTLLYNSQVAFPLPLITLDAKLPSGTNVPDSIGYTVKVNNVDRNTEVLKDSLSLWSDNARRRIQVGWDAKLDPTDVYNVTVRVKTYYPGGTSFTDSVSTETIVVNRNYSPLGLGWWIGGVEQVFIPSNNTNNRLWVAGDGSARIYRATATANVWVADDFDRPDTLKFASSQYERKVPGGARVTFNAQGQHISTTDARGYATTFTYLSSTAGAPVVSIKLPKLDSMYRFKYKTPGVDTAALDTVYSPNANLAGTAAPARKTIVKSYVRVLYQFFDPKGSDEFYAIGGTGGGAGRIIFRREKGGTESAYTYDSHAQLSEAYVDSMVIKAKTVICPFFTVNNPIASCGTRVRRATAAEVTVDGPRPNSPAADLWAYRVHRFGAPEMIRDPKGNVTRIFRETGTCGNPPAFVNKVIEASGLETWACPDARGNVATKTVYNGTAPGMTQTTTYTWDPRWDKVTSIIRGSETEFIATYDAAGNPDSIADSRSNSATRFYYYGAGSNANLLNVAKAPARRGSADDFEYFTYDALGNPNGVYEYSDSVGTTTRANSGAHYNQDAIGRTIQSCVDIDSLQLTIPPQSCTYFTLDPLGRDSVTTQYAVAQGGASAQGWTVRKYFGNESELIAVSRERSADTVHFTRYIYDHFGRVVTDSIVGHPAIYHVYDKAGNLTSTTNRRGQTVTMTYDEMNRLTQKVVPQVIVAASTPASSVGATTSPNEAYPWKPNNSTSYEMAAETFNFTYDVMGRMLTATNNDSEVRRTYYLNGLLDTDSLYIRAAAGGFLKYGQKNRYDFYDRRSSILLDATLRTGATRDSIGFQYYPTSNELLQVTDPMGNTFVHLYNRRSELVELQMSGNVANETFKYDAVGNILRDTITTSAGTVRAQRFTYDSRHKLRTMDDATGLLEQDRFKYSGLGYLTSSEMKYSKSAGTIVSLQRETMTYDDLGTMLTTFTDDSLKIPSNSHKDSWNGTHTLDKDWRLATSAPGNGLGLRSYTYDADWNVTFYRQALSNGYQEDRMSYYDAENRLRAADYRKGYSQPPLYFPMKVFEQYRYDALGRRIWVRADKDCNGSAFGTSEQLCDLSTLRRTIWDGDRELFEVQVPVKILGDINQSNSVLDNDLYNASMPRGPNGGDANPYFGRVLYINGLTLDKPLGIVRFNYSDVDLNVAPDTNHFFMPVAAMTFLWDQKGKVADVICSTGTLRCAGTRNGGTPASLRVDIPEKYFVVERTALLESTWQGTLITDKGDAARTNYRRNRYYDPTSGRFSQADPIGLAGGLNLFGFGNGDPLNNSDPFGLCPPTDKNPNDCPGKIGALVMLGQRAPAINQAVATLAVAGVAGGLGAAVELGAAASAAIDATVLTVTKTVAKNAASRPYQNSSLLMQEIMAGGKAIADPGGIAGGLRWDVPGYFGKSKGVWELVVDPKNNEVVHFLFKSQK